MPKENDSGEHRSKPSPDFINNIVRQVYDTRKRKYTWKQRIKRTRAGTIFGIIISLGAICLLSLGLWQMAVGLAAVIHVVWFFRNRYVGNCLTTCGASLTNGLAWIANESYTYANDAESNEYIFEASKVWDEVVRPIIDLHVDLKRLQRWHLYDDPYELQKECDLFMSFIDDDGFDPSYLFRLIKSNSTKLSTVAQHLLSEARRISG